MLILPSAFADVTIVETPPDDAGSIYVSDTLTLTFRVDYSGSTDSRAAISVGFISSGWTYADFTVTIDSTDVSAGFTEVTSANKVDLTNNDLDPDEGTLTVSLNFIATTEGAYTFDWSSVFSIISGTSPDIKTAMDTTTTTVVEAPPPQATIESCDATGVLKSVFDLDETVYVCGSRCSPSTTTVWNYSIFVVNDVRRANRFNAFTLLYVLTLKS